MSDEKTKAKDQPTEAKPTEKPAAKAPQMRRIRCLRNAVPPITVVDENARTSYTFDATKPETMEQDVPERVLGLLGLNRKATPGGLDVPKRRAGVQYFEVVR